MSFFGKTVEMLVKGYASVDEKGKKEVATPEPKPASAINTPPSQSAAQTQPTARGYGTFK